MHALSTTHPMSKITRSAISRKLVNQKKKKKVGRENIFLHLYTGFGSKFKIPIATEIQQLFRHLTNRHLMAHQTAQR